MKKIAVSGISLPGLLTTLRFFSQQPETQVTFFANPRELENDKQEMGGCTLYPKGDFFPGISKSIRDEIHQLAPTVTWQNVAANHSHYTVLKEGLIAEFPKNFRKIYTSSLVFITEKIKCYLSLRKKYSLWPDMSVHRAAQTIFGDNFAEYIVSPLVRKMFLSEAEDIELGSILPALCDYLSRGGQLKSLVSKIEVPAHETMFPANGYSQLLSSLLQTIPQGKVLFVNDTITRYKGQGVVQCGSREYGPFETVVLSQYDNLEKIFRKDFPEISEQASLLKVNYLNSVYLAYDRKKIYAKGMGVLLPRKEKLPLLFCDYLSNIDPTRAPEHLFLLRCVIAGDTDVFHEEDLIAFSADSIRKIFRTREKPLYSRAFRKVSTAPVAGKGSYRFRQALQKLEFEDKHLLVLTES